MEDKHIVAIDLGSSKFALTVANINDEDVQVVYYKEIPSEGIRNSSAYNTKKIYETLKPLIEDAEQELNIKITQAVVGLPKYRVRQEVGRARVERTDHQDECITEEEINDLKETALYSYPLKNDVDEKLFGAVAQSFSNGEGFQLVEDDIIGIPSPILEGNFKVFIGKSSPLYYVDVAFNKLGIAPIRKYFTPDAVAKAVLTPSEMENGVALIDFGGGATSVSVYFGSIMRHFASIPFGGKVITSDIKTECMISDSLAENIKMAFGACMPDKLLNLSEKTIQITGGSGSVNKQLPVKYLSEVITHRVQEIIEAILYEIELSGFADQLRNGLVVTGGGAELTNCVNFIKELSGYTVRKGYPRHLFSAMGAGSEGIFETSAATSVGLIMTAKNDHVSDCVAGEETVEQGAEVRLGESGETAAASAEAGVAAGGISGGAEGGAVEDGSADGSVSGSAGSSEGGLSEGSSESGSAGGSASGDRKLFDDDDLKVEPPKDKKVKKKEKKEKKTTTWIIDSIFEFYNKVSKDERV